MEMLAKVGGALQRLFGQVAETLARSTGAVKRVREFTPMSLAKTFVLGYLKNPRASPEDLAAMAVECGVAVSPQAVDQRRTQELGDFLQGLVREALQTVIASSRSLAPILERFVNVDIIDSTTITLPDSLKDQYAGCGGGYGQGQAALKLQTELDLRSGKLSHIEIEPGKSPDAATCRQHADRQPGSLRISDLGYFNVPVFAVMNAVGAYFLSRLQFGTGVLLQDGTPVKLLDWLATQTGPFIDRQILLGLKERLSCRLIAWRVPEEVANRRRQKLIADMRSRKGKLPSAERLAWCDWSILVTNVPEDLLTPIEATVLYRARWQIELLFKRWKSQGLLAQLTGSTDERQMVAFWSRLLACIIQHWLLVTLVWGEIRISLNKAGRAIRNYAERIAANCQSVEDLIKMLTTLMQSITKTARRNRRTKPGTFELLNNTKLLDFCLT